MLLSYTRRNGVETFLCWDLRRPAGAVSFLFLGNKSGYLGRLLWLWLLGSSAVTPHTKRCLPLPVCRVKQHPFTRGKIAGHVLSYAVYALALIVAMVMNREQIDRAPPTIFIRFFWFDKKENNFFLSLNKFYIPKSNFILCFFLFDFSVG